MDLGVSGLASGFDWKSLVDQLADVERAPQTRLRTEQGTLRQRNNAYTGIKTQLSTLQTRVKALMESDLYSARAVSTSDATSASASVSAGAATGSYLFRFTQLASAASQVGTSNVAAPLNGTDDVSALSLSSAGFSRSVSEGSFTVNGKQVAVASGDTLGQVFQKISDATGGAVTANYSSAQDKITFSSASPIILGSAYDTSNFLQVTKLATNGTGAVSSSGTLGTVHLTGSIDSANLAGSITDGGSTTGEFTINGVSITFDTSKDSLQNILDRINTSKSNVQASYDTVNNRFVLANKTTGDVGVSLADVSGKFLQGTGLSAGTLQRGKNLLYTVNGGAEQVGQSNTVTEATSGLSGLSVTAIKEGGSASVTVASDTSKIRTAINDFVSEYNRAQSMIDSQTASSADSSGKVTAGILANDTEANDIANSLRRTAYSMVTGLSGTLNHLEKIGIKSSGYDNSLTVSDTDVLDDALNNNLTGLRDLFADETYGIATQLSSYLERTIGETGTLITKQSTLTKQTTDIDTQVADMERVVLSSRQRMIDSFLAMEKAQQNSNQQLAYLQRSFGG
jgi:flagellar hook-associated protein 2